MAHLKLCFFLVLCLIFLRFCRIISTHCNVGIDDNLGRECLSAEWVGMKKMMRINCFNGFLRISSISTLTVMSLPSSALPK